MAKTPVARLAHQGTGDIVLGLARIEAALKALSAPERRLPPVIHVAGTNGKGSVIAFLKAMLEAGGMTVHSFTSPALFHAGEQISCAGISLDDEAIEQLADEVEAAAPEPLTPFEVLTAAAFLAFARAPADILLLEAGLGAAGDATNVITRPALTILTPIGLDHAEHLGPTLTQIVRAKTGLFKPGVPAVIAPQSEEVLDLIEAAARRQRITLFRQGTEWNAFAQGGRLVYQDEGGLLDLPLPALAGRHQVDNAGTAIAAVRALAGLGLSEEAIAEGLVNVRWPGRLEPVRRGPLVAALPEGSELWLDVGHNPHAAAALAEFAADRHEHAPMPLALVTALLATKDAEAFFRAFAGLAQRVLTVPIPNDPRTAPEEMLMQAAAQAGLAAEAAPSLSAALTRIGSTAPGPVRVLVCGTFGLVRAAGQAHV